MANTVLYQHFPSVTVYSPKLQWLQRNNLHTLISRELERRCFFQGLLIPIFCHSQLGCLVLSSTSKCISQYQKILVHQQIIASPEFQLLGNGHPNYHICYIIDCIGNVKYEESVEISS